MTYVIPVFDSQHDVSEQTLKMRRFNRLSARVFLSGYLLLGAAVLLEVLAAIAQQRHIVFFLIPVTVTALALTIIMYVLNIATENREQTLQAQDYDRFATKIGAPFFAQHHDLPTFNAAQQRSLLHGDAVVVEQGETVQRYVPTVTAAGRYELRVFTRMPA